MYLLGLGVVLLLLKALAIGPVEQWSWWIVLAPFALAALWWSWADWSGYTKRRAMEKEDSRKAARIARSKQALRSGPHRRP